MMLLLTFHVVLLWFTDPSLSSEIIQTSDVIKTPGMNVNLSCTHTYNNFFYLFWYQRTKQDTSLKLTGYLYTTTFNKETDYEKRFHIYGDAKSEGILQISNLNSDDDAVYFCAVKEGGRPAGANQAYFGGGTKLTVLDPNILITKPASVKVLSVAEKETCTKTNVTLVCMAKGFYPDHVDVYWSGDNGNRSTDVSTDEVATRNGSFYSITSRLNINYKTEWTKGLTFKCNVVFFDGTEYSTMSDSITGPKIKSGGEYTAETYVRKVKTTMLGYSMFIAQSLIYGLIILVIVKRQGKSK